MARQEINAETPLQQREHEFYRSIFTRYDTDGDGSISCKELSNMIKNQEYDDGIPRYCIREILRRADQNRDDRIDFEEFVAMINNPDLQNLFGRYVRRYAQAVVPPRRATTGEPAREEEYSFWPPPMGMVVISIIELVFFCVDETSETGSTNNATGPISSILSYDPYERKEMWRFITYMFVHAGAFHLIVNLLVQLVLGFFLELEHKWWRVLIIYFSGGLTGSLATSITDPTVQLVGASGGVYALFTAHVASIILNWTTMPCPVVQLFLYVIIGGCDLGTAIYERSHSTQPIGYVAHFGGAVAGLLVGLNVLRNKEVTRVEKILWWVSLVTYALLMGGAIVWNVAWPGYFPKPKNAL